MILDSSFSIFGYLIILLSIIVIFSLCFYKDKSLALFLDLSSDPIIWEKAQRILRKTIKGVCFMLIRLWPIWIFLLVWNRSYFFYAIKKTFLDSVISGVYTDEILGDVLITITFSPSVEFHLFLIFFFTSSIILWFIVWPYFKNMFLLKTDKVSPIMFVFLLISIYGVIFYGFMAGKIFLFFFLFLFLFVFCWADYKKIFIALEKDLFVSSTWQAIESLPKLLVELKTKFLLQDSELEIIAPEKNLIEEKYVFVPTSILAYYLLISIVLTTFFAIIAFIFAVSIGNFLVPFFFDLYTHSIENKNYFTNLYFTFSSILPELSLITSLIIFSLYAGQKKENQAQSFPLIHNQFAQLYKILLLTQVFPFVGLICTLLNAFFSVSFNGCSLHSFWLFEDMLLYSPFTTLLKYSILAIFLLITIYTRQYFFSYFQTSGLSIFILFNFLTLSCCLLVATHDFFGLFLGFELISFGSYIFIVGSTVDEKSIDAAIKYYIISAFSTIFIGLGCAFLLLLCGSTHFVTVATQLYNPTFLIELTFIDVSNLIAITFFLFFSGLFFKLGIFPFHRVIVTVYSSLDWFTFCLLNVPIKLVFLIVFIECYLCFIHSTHLFLLIFLLIGLNGSLLVGSFGALQQTRLKKFLAYASVSQMGLILIGFMPHNAWGLSLSFIFSLVYIVTMLIFILIIIYCDQLLVLYNSKIEFLSDLNSFYLPVFWQKFYQISVGILLCSLAGLPPFLGFFIKVEMISLIVVQSYYWTMGIILLTSVISAFYYLRLLTSVLSKFTNSNKSAPSQAGGNNNEMEPNSEKNQMKELDVVLNKTRNNEPLLRYARSLKDLFLIGSSSKKSFMLHLPNSWRLFWQLLLSQLLWVVMLFFPYIYKFIEFMGYYLINPYTF